VVGFSEGSFFVPIQSLIHQERDSRLRLVLPEAYGLAAYLGMFMLHQEAAHHTPKTLSYYRYTLSKFLDYLSVRGIKAPEAVKATHIRAFLAHLQKQGYADTTVHGHARAIKAFFNFLVTEEVLDASPMRKVTMPKLEQKILPPFSGEDIEALLEACQHGKNPHRDRAMILCLLDSGLRAAEFVAMNVGDVDKGGLVRVHGKGMKDRYVRLGASARKAMLRYLARRKPKQGEPLWAGKRGRLTTSGLYQVMRRLGKRAGVHCYPHRFRRTFAVWALRGGMNVHHLRAILGHADLQMALRYLQLVKEDIEEAHKQASPVNHFLGKKR
jgi:integrase/recombinase XerD